MAIKKAKKTEKTTAKIATKAKVAPKTATKVAPKVATKPTPKVASKVTKVAPKVATKAVKVAPKVVSKATKVAPSVSAKITPKATKVVAKTSAKPTAKITKKAAQIKVLEKMTEPTEKIRYTDPELLEFKEIILRKLDEARSDLALLTEAYTTKNANDTNDTSPTFKVLEEGSNVLSKEENSQLASRQQKFIRDLENALLRIDNKTYGICRVTGKLIPKERLKVVPHATMSIEAKLSQQKIKK